MTEARLVAQALGGAQPAYEQIVRRYQRSVINFIARLTGDAAGAEDLAQETFVKAFRNLGTFDASRRFSSWLLRIAHNTTVDAMRRSRVRTVPFASSGEPDRAGVQAREPQAPDAPDPVEQRALADALARALSILRPEYRAAIILRYQESLSFDEIGMVLRVPSATARTFVHRARKELAGVLTEAGWAPGP